MYRNRSSEFSGFPDTLFLQTGLLLVLFCFLSVQAAAQTESYRYRLGSNNSTFPKTVIEQLLQKHQQAHPDSLRKFLLTELADNGFFSARVQLTREDSTDSITVVTITGGREYLIERFVIYDAAWQDSLQITGTMDLLTNTGYTAQAVFNSTQDVLKRYENAGFPFAKLTITQIGIDTVRATVILYFSFDRGKRCTVDRIMVKGNVDTRDYVVGRQCRIPSGSEYRQSEIDKVKNRLMKLRLFASVSDPVYYIASDGSGVLQVEVKEKNNNTFDGIIGYMPGTKQTDKGYFTGLVNIQMRNLFGTGRGAAIRWQKLERSTSELELQYTEPWMFNYPLTLETRYYQKQQDSSYVQRSIEAAIDYAATGEFSLGFEFGYQRVIPTLRDIPVFTGYNASSSFTGIRFRFDTRDDPLLPREGYMLQNYYRFVSKTISGPAEYITADTKTHAQQQKIILDAQYLQPLTAAFILSAGLHAREIRGSMIESADLYRLGGTNSLRGYRENQFSAGRVAWLNLEGRSFMARRSYAFLFFDAGYLKQSENAALKITHAEAVKTGFGAGLVLESGLGLMNVSFALGKGDSFSQGKIHFGLVNEF